MVAGAEEILWDIYAIANGDISVIAKGLKGVHHFLTTEKKGIVDADQLPTIS